MRRPQEQPSPEGTTAPKEGVGVFSQKRVWTKGCDRVMGYDRNLPANQLGGQI